MRLSTTQPTRELISRKTEEAGPLDGPAPSVTFFFQVLGYTGDVLPAAIFCLSFLLIVCFSSFGFS